MIAFFFKKGKEKPGLTNAYHQTNLQGKVPLIIDVTSADTMATLIALKTEIETQKNSTIHMAFSRATEAHLIAKEIGTLKN